MIQLKPTISLVLDERRRLTSGLYPIRLRVTFQVIRKGKKAWVQKYYPTNQSCGGKEEFLKILDGTSRRTDHKDIRKAIRDIEKDAIEKCDSQTYVNPELFDRLFAGRSLTTVAGLFDHVMKELSDNAQEGTKIIYQTARESIIKFGGDGLVLVEITPTWLKKYQHWMKNQKDEDGNPAGRSVSTISIYLRCLRRVFNVAIGMSLISRDLYPFGSRNYTIQNEVKSKVALDIEQKNLLINYAGGTEEMKRAIDFWTFSYYCNGMNMNDVARLKVHQISDDRFFFDRFKTINTAKIIRKIEVFVRPEVEKIISRRGNKTLNPKAYVFPVLEAGLTPGQEKSRIHDFIRDINDGLREVGKKLKFNFRLTTYTARHTFANTLMQLGFEDSEIQEALGHASIKTTQVYKGSFSQDRKKKRSLAL